MHGLEDFDERGFLLGTRKIEKLLRVSSLSRRNYPFTRVVTTPVSISTMNPLPVKNSINF